MVTFGEFLRHICLWLLLTKYSTGSMNRKVLWLSKVLSRLGCVSHRFNNIMRGKRFEDITQCLQFIDLKPQVSRIDVGKYGR